MFQSLLGFLMRCDAEKLTPRLVDSIGFQSLLGFLMRCDGMRFFSSMILMIVSIPAGFSDALRQLRTDHHYSRYSVSIPAGFSDALRLYNDGAQTLDIFEFQSLLGFLMRCDVHSSR